MRDSTFWALLLLCALVTIIIVIATGGLPVMAATVEPQASATPEPCLPINSAEGQMLYLCESDYAPDCVWDPSTNVGTGMLSCDW